MSKFPHKFQRRIDQAHQRDREQQLTEDARQTRIDALRQFAVLVAHHANARPDKETVALTVAASPAQRAGLLRRRAATRIESGWILQLFTGQAPETVRLDQLMKPGIALSESGVLYELNLFGTSVEIDITESNIGELESLLVEFAKDLSPPSGLLVRGIDVVRWAANQTRSRIANVVQDRRGRGGSS